MRELLNASSQRMIKIIETLAVREGWTTLAELSSAVEASERTVAEDIAKLKKQWGPQLNLESSQKNGVRLQNQNAASIGLVFADIFNQSVALRWIEELLFHPNNTVEFYGEKLFVSRSTLLRLLPKINRLLSQREIEIQCRNNRYQLLAKNEQYLRDFSAGFLLELHGLDLRKYDVNVDLSIIKQLLLAAFAKNLEPRAIAWIVNDDISVTYQIMFYLVSLVREEQGYAVCSRYPVEEEVGAQDLRELRTSFPHLKTDNLRPIHQFLIDRYVGWSTEAEKILVTREAEAFFQRMFSVIPVFPNEDTRYLLRFMLITLYLNKKFCPYKASMLFDRIYYFSLSIKRANPLLYRVTKENLSLFSQKVNLEMASSTANVLFWSCLACPMLSRYAKPKTALLIDDFGRPHAKFLAEVLSGFFNKENFEFLRIDIAPYPDVLASAENFDRIYNVVITTVPNLPFFHRHVLLINDYPDRNDLCEIYKTLKSF